MTPLPLYKGPVRFSGETGSSRAVVLLYQMLALVSVLFVLGASMAVGLNVSVPGSLIVFIGLVFCVIIWLWPFYGLLALLFAMPLQFLAKVTEDGSITVSKLIFPLLFGIWITRHIIHRDRRLFSAFVAHPAFVAALLYLLSTMPSFMKARDLDYAYGFLFLKLIPMFIVAVLIADMIQSRQQLAWVYKTILAVSMLVGAFGIYELVTGQSILNAFGMDYGLIAGRIGGGLASTKWKSNEGMGDVEWFRVGSTFLDPDFFGGYLILSLGFAAGLWFLTSSWPWRASILVYVVIAVIDIVATGSRGCLVGLVALGGLQFLLFRFPLRKALLSLLVLGFICLIPFIDKLMPAYRTGISMEAFYSDPRYGLWTMALNMFKSKPFFGIGLANFLEAYSAFKVAAVNMKPFLAHNILLGVLAETGIVGLTFFIAFIVTVLLTLGRVCVRATGSLRCASGQLLAAVIAFGLFSLTSNTLDFEYMWVSVGVTVVLARWQQGILTDSRAMTPGGIDGSSPD